MLSWFGLYVALLLMTFGEIGLYIVGRLTPNNYLWTNIAKTALATGAWLVAVIGSVVSSARAGSNVLPNIAFGIALFWLFEYVVISLLAAMKRNINDEVLTFRRFSLVVALVQAMLMRREQSQIWARHTLDEHEQNEAETAPLIRRED